MAQTYCFSECPRQHIKTSVVCCTGRASKGDSNIRRFTTVCAIYSPISPYGWSLLIKSRPRLRYESLRNCRIILDDHLRQPSIQVQVYMTISNTTSGVNQAHLQHIVSFYIPRDWLLLRAIERALGERPRTPGLSPHVQGIPRRRCDPAPYQNTATA